MGSPVRLVSFKLDHGVFGEPCLIGFFWGLVEPLIPPGKTGGGKRTVVMREVVNGLMYILSTGCQWRAIPKDLPPRSSVYGYFDLWTYDGTLERIHHALYEQCRHHENASVAVLNVGRMNDGVEQQA